MRGLVMMSSEHLPDPILITGCARSGTSLIAGSVALCGAFGGVTRGATSSNQKGMWENARIVNTITKPYLRSLGLDPLGQYPLPDINNLPIPTDWRRRVEQVMVEEGYPGTGPWYYKGAKSCLFFPVWTYAFPSAKWIIVRRRTGDIVNSCLHTGFMKAFSRREFQKAVGAADEREGWVWWCREHEKRFVEMITAGLNCRVIWPERLVSGDYSQLMETIEWLGLKWNSEVLNFIDPKLWKARRK
jgi:hypothetical protein